MGKAADVVKDVYAAFGRGDVPAVLGAFDSAIEWTEAEGFVYADGNPYVGPQAVAAGVFGRVIADMDNFAIHPTNFIDGGETVVSEKRLFAAGLIVNGRTIASPSSNGRPSNG